MSNNNEFANCLVANLKSLNAKEREYLVRYAYQGDEQDRPPLSEAMIRDLRKLFPNELGSADCRFAGMDYHLDWLHVALYLACKSVTVEEAQSNKRVESLGKFEDEVDKTLRPVTGGQEDVDLLAVFVDGSNTILLFIEAKGVGSFGRVQLARKLVRLDRILAASGARECKDLKCEFVLTGPERESEWHGSENLFNYAKTLPEEHRLLTDRLVEHPLHIGLRKWFLPLTGFPGSLKKVTRTKSSKSADFTHWKITSR